MSTLEADIALILSQAKPVLYGHQFGTPPARTFVGRQKDDWVHEGVPYQRKSREVDLLVRMFTQQNADHQVSFVKFMLARLTTHTVELIAHTFVEIRQLPALLTFNFHDVITPQQKEFLVTALFRDLRAKLALEPHLFGHREIEAIDALVATGDRLVANSPKVFVEGGHGAYRRLPAYQDLQKVATSLSLTVRRVKFLQLAARLESGENPAVDRDREVLQQRLAILALSPELSRALDRAATIGERSTDPFDYKGAMDWLRSFFEQLAQALAARVGEHIGKPFAAHDGRSFNPAKQFLRSTEILNSNDEELLQAVYNYLSREGTHQLASSREQFYMMKVCVIEWGLVLAGRVQALVAARR